MRRINYPPIWTGLLTGIAVFCTGDAATSGEVAARKARPNVVLIYADDLGWGDLSVHGGKTPTPNIDRIFNQGVRLNSFYTHAVCSPSRAGLLTGRHYIHVKAGPLTGGELKLEETTIAESFKAAGYATGAFGKWHNGAPTSYGDYEVKEGEDLYLSTGPRRECTRVRPVRGILRRRMGLLHSLLENVQTRCLV
ncbi:MAG: sulfatase-like hydrolase/transferase [Pirellulaceae bacterium]|nr:sulfatase-like hydrolase/transferase [Pirellulaceae bacterium]